MSISRRFYLKLSGAATVSALFFKALPAAASDEIKRWWRATPKMDAMTALRTRRSVRKYTTENVHEADLKEILGAAMSAPSAGNEQPWEFVVVNNPENMKKIATINKYASFVDKAPLGILVCMNSEYEKFPGNGLLDTSAACQNILLAAHALGLGAVWTGVYPEKDRLEAFTLLMNLPDTVVPVAFIAIGHPASSPKSIDRYDKSRIHREKWSKS